jgi:hypothetical protein
MASWFTLAHRFANVSAPMTRRPLTRLTDVFVVGVEAPT